VSHACFGTEIFLGPKCPGTIQSGECPDASVLQWRMAISEAIEKAGQVASPGLLTGPSFQIYTVSQKNCANLFFVITLPNFDGL